MGCTDCSEIVFGISLLQLSVCLSVICDRIAFIVRIGPLEKWVDDNILFRIPPLVFTELDFTSLSAAFGVNWKASKERKFAIIQRYIGLIWHLQNKTVSIPDDKRDAYLALIDSWLLPGAKFTAAEAARLHGKLVHASLIVRLGRPFIASISRFANTFKSDHARLQPPGPLLSDLKWYKSLLQAAPAVLPLQDSEVQDIGWWGDASKTRGVAIIIGKWYCAWRWKAGVTDRWKVDERDIGWGEAIAVELGVLLLCYLVDQKLLFLKSGAAHFLVRSDNQGVVRVVTKGRSRQQETNSVLARLYKVLSSRGYWLSTEYVTSKDNISDILTRADESEFLRQFPESIRVDLPLPDHLANLFQ